VTGEASFLLRTTFEDYFVRVSRFSSPLSAERQELTRHALFHIRYELEGGEPGLFETVQHLLNALDRAGPSMARRFGASSTDEMFQRELIQRLEEELGRGRIVIDFRPPISSLSDRRQTLFAEDLPPLPPAPRQPNTHSFELRLLDEIGKAISGLDAELTADGPRTATTNAAGIALVEGVQASTAAASLLDPEALAKVLDPRWQTFRPGKPPKESNLQEVVFRGGELGPFALKAEVPNTVVIKPPLGKLFVELFDKTGRVHHAERKFTISGPQPFEGVTDEAGLLLQEQVFPGDYTLSLTLEHFKGDPDERVETVESALVVLEPEDGQPQVRLLGAVPRSVLARLHMFFNTNKAFLLPTALPSVRKLRKLYIDNAPCQLLVVGHADTKGGTAFNDKLSLERAEATVAFLKDDVEAWFKLYGADIEQKKRWGKVEDRLMILSMPDFVTKPKGEDAVRWFQRTRSLEVDGDAGKQTRRALIEEYMSLDGASLSDLVGEIEATAHGCGENFPLDDTGEELDEAPANEKRDPGDRRVELYFFDDEFGISPKAPGQSSKPGSREYPLWRQRVAEVVELRADDLAGPKVTFVELADAHFRTDSAVVLPEGENPDQAGEHEALTSAGLIATALRFNEENPGRTVLVAGHTDTAADAGFNQKLSEERAQVALALLKGGAASRERFKELCAARHRVADIKQILSWVTRAFVDFAKPAFDCDPGAINDFPNDQAVRRFQEAFNAHKSELGSKAPDLKPDGEVGKFTWGAFFDCYELALQRELGEDTESLKDLRQKLRFTDPERESLGFSEYFPIEELGVNDFRSQANRRVELLFFESGEEPDLVQAADDPETSDLYLPGNYQRTTLVISEEDLIFGHIDIRLHVPLQRARTDGEYRLFSSNVDFDLTLPATAAFRESAEFLALRFPRMNRRGVYTLEQILGTSRISIFADLPFSRLRVQLHCSGGRDRSGRVGPSDPCRTMWVHSRGSMCAPRGKSCGSW